VLEGDAVYGNLKSIKEVPSGQIDRLKHYFLTYKEIPNQTRAPKIQVTDVYDREIALQVITQSMKDYKKLVGRSSR
jgi:inorganic pyrophosphatase